LLYLRLYTWPKRCKAGTADSAEAALEALLVEEEEAEDQRQQGHQVGGQKGEDDRG